MIRKIFCLSVLLTTFSIFCLAQTEKGTWMLGGKGFIGSLGKGFYVNLEPNGGYFLYDNFAVGGLFKLQAATESNSTEFILGPYARYYLGKGNVKALGEMAVGLNIAEKTILTFQLGLGAAWFVRENVSLDFLAIYGINDNNNGLVGDRFGVNAGFQIYFFR